VAAGKAVVAVDLPFHGERRSEPHGSIMLYPPHPHFMKVSATVCNTLLAELPGTLDAIGVTKPVTALGHSLGGRIAYHMALRNLAVKRVICVGSPIGVESIPKGANFTEKDYGYWQEIDPFAGTESIRRVPITFIHGANDKVCPLFTIERLQGLIHETSPDVIFEIKVIPDAGHELVGALEAAALAELLEA
jgi:pimeloyl-ACP methyl ester carboxylesterase